jgi:2'-5' RNA ligase
MEQVRSFISIELPLELRQELTRLQAGLKAGSRVPVKWVEPENIHLTLKFLGNINASLTPRITAAMEEAAHGIHPFCLEVSGLGVFPNPRRVQVIWVGLTGELESLVQLQKRVESGLVSLGFAVEGRSFAPHLTLARVRDQATPAERQSLGQLIAGTIFKTDYRLNVESVQLMRSQLTREGPVYTRISSVALK